MKKRTLLACIAVLSLNTTAFCGRIPLPTTLDMLLPDGDFVTVGDLTFDNFTYLASGDMPTPEQINVDALGDTGIRFTGPFLDLPGGVGNGASDATLAFTVTSGSLIDGVTLSGNPSVLAGPGSGSASVTETFVGIANAKLDIFDITTGLNTIDSVSIPGTNSLSVIKDILLFTADPEQEATLSVIDQSFSIPEPSSSSLCLLAGFVGIAAVRKKRRA